MNKFAAGMILVCLVGVMLIETSAAQKKKNSSPFKDKNLEAAIKQVLRFSKGGLTDKNLANVYVLQATDKNIKDLSGLEKCYNLQHLKLSKNHIVNISPLKDLKNLISLDLSGNKIKDISALAGLKALQYIELSDNEVANLAPLAKLENMAALYLSGNKIKDLSPLVNLKKLYTLSVNRNQIQDLKPLEKITHISTLGLEHNRISDLAPLKKQHELSLLMLRHNKIKNLAPLVDMCQADAKGEKRFAPYLRLYVKEGNPLGEQAQKQLQKLTEIGVRVH